MGHTPAAASCTDRRPIRLGDLTYIKDMSTRPTMGDGQMGCLMATMDISQAWSLFRRTASTLSSCRRGNFMAGALATGMTGLPAAAASMLMFASAPLAHTPSQRDHERPARHASPLPGEPVEAMALPGCVPTTAIFFSVAASAADAGIPWGEAEGIDFNHDTSDGLVHVPPVERRLAPNGAELHRSSLLHSRRSVRRIARSLFRVASGFGGTGDPSL